MFTILNANRNQIDHNNRRSTPKNNKNTIEILTVFFLLTYGVFKFNHSFIHSKYLRCFSCRHMAPPSGRCVESPRRCRCLRLGACRLVSGCRALAWTAYLPPHGRPPCRNITIHGTQRILSRNHTPIVQPS